MQMLHAARRRWASYDSGSISAEARRRRWQALAARFPAISEMAVLDVGGDVRAWRLAGVRPAHVTLLNVYDQDAAGEDWISVVVGDACEPPALARFDLVYSNSVIEHLGGHWRRARFAELVRTAAPHYWVQTPYRYFPVEPHYFAPGVQFLPRAAATWALARWPLGPHAGRPRAAVLAESLGIELLSATELSHYFPDGHLLRERLAGLTKSLIAMR